MFPFWLRFRGGKGVATSLGVLLGFWPILTVPALIATAIWITVIATSRYSSLASISGAVSLPICLLVLTAVRDDGLPGRTPLLVVHTFLALLIVVRHRANIARLRAGTEPKVGQPVINDPSHKGYSPRPRGPGQE
jgi:glycerol-3-phosphate acyltransferase PlsY